jgi:hypothetical protein
VNFLAPPDQTALLRETIRQSELSGAMRRALLLHTDRLPSPMAKPHHLRLAREALNAFLSVDRAQFFELSRRRTAIVWRGRATAELGHAMEALAHLLSGQPDAQAPSLNQLVSLYDLPQQAVALLDELVDEGPERTSGPSLPMDVKQLAALEATLAQADLAPFARWRTVMRLSASGPATARLARIDVEPAWEERYFATHAVAASLCPDRGIKADPWLFRRLTRTLDRRMLAMLSQPRDPGALPTFAIHLNVATILAAEFLHFDGALPLALRGEVILNLRPADVLADPSAFLFARNFVRPRGYRLGLVGASLPLLKVLDTRAAGFDYVHVKLAAEDPDSQALLQSVQPDDPSLVVTGLDRVCDLRWAVSNGVTLGRGRAVMG